MRAFNRFSRWVLPLQMFGSLIMLYGFVRIVTATDATGIAIGLLGALAWPAATLIEERSPLFKRLTAASVGRAMATKPVVVPSSWRIIDVRKRFDDLGTDSFFLVLQNRYTRSVALPETVHRVPGEDARYRTVGEVAHPISYVDAVRPDDALLEAFNRLDSPRLEYVAVLDERGTLAGVINRRHIADYLRTHPESTVLHARHSGAERPALSANQIAA
jgi:CBS domain-containing protein